MTCIQSTQFNVAARKYLSRLYSAFSSEILKSIEILCEYLSDAWKERRQVFICGNGGSAANAIHIANDLHYGIGACGSPPIPGMR